MHPRMGVDPYTGVDLRDGVDLYRATTNEMLGVGEKAWGTAAYLSQVLNPT